MNFGIDITNDFPIWKCCYVCFNIKFISDFPGIKTKCLICKECNNRRRKKYVEKNRKKVNEKAKNAQKTYRIENSSAIKESGKRFRKKHKEKLSKINKNYRLLNKQKLNEQKSIYRKKRKQTDSEYKLMCNLRRRVHNAMSKCKKDNTIRLIGCNIAKFKKWIEWQFDDNMNWENYGIYWHIDHVIPCSSFSLELQEEQYKCFNWSNCRPLNKEENIKKSDKFITDEINKHKLKITQYLEKNS
jgi:hypothetical protein